jgi:hypothetical protein
MVLDQSEAGFAPHTVDYFRQQGASVNAPGCARKSTPSSPGSTTSPAEFGYTLPTFPQLDSD